MSFQIKYIDASSEVRFILKLTEKSIMVCFQPNFHLNLLYF